MSKGGPPKRAKLLRLWEEDKRCLWCQQETVLVFRPPTVTHRQLPPLPNEATLEHLHSRLNDERGRHAGSRTILLACWRCNSERNRHEEAAVPVEELRRRARSGRGTQNKAEGQD